MLFLPFPDWNGLHPLVVHFPIALLFVAPVLVVLGLVARNGRKYFFASALVLMVIGTVALFMAVSTGAAAEELAEHVPNAAAVLERHEDLAGVARTVFTILTLLFLGIVAAPALTKRTLQGPYLVVVHAAFLLFYAAGMIVLANAAHEGGRLVHEVGVRAAIASSQSPAAEPGAGEPAQARESEDEVDDDD